MGGRVPPLYPSANLLVSTKKDFEPQNRKKFCGRIATGDYDAVIIGHSQFERIPVSQERQEKFLEAQIEEINDGIAELKAQNGEKYSIKQMEKTRAGLKDWLKKLQASPKKDDVVTFEQLGVDRLFVDEAHNYKNLFCIPRCEMWRGSPQPMRRSPQISLRHLDWSHRQNYDSV